MHCLAHLSQCACLAVDCTRGQRLSLCEHVRATFEPEQFFMRVCVCGVGGVLFSVVIVVDGVWFGDCQFLIASFLGQAF